MRRIGLRRIRSQQGDTDRDLGAALSDLLARDRRVLEDRAKSEFLEQAASVGSRVVLSGAGNLGRRVLAGLRRVGVEPLAFCDVNPQLDGARVEGLTVFSPERAAERYGNEALFVVTVWRAGGPDSMPERIGRLRALGCRHVVTFVSVFRAFPGEFLPHFLFDSPDSVIECGADVQKAFELWSDDFSRGEFVAQMRLRLEGDFGAMAKPWRGEIYFSPELVRLGPAEVFVDAGAYDGDTLRRFLHHSGGKFRRVFAFEPDPTNFDRLTRFVGTLPHGVSERIRVEQAALGAEDGFVMFSATGDDNARVGSGNLRVPSIALDEFLQGFPPTYIKSDTEGSEPELLEGARNSISRHRPLLAISAYHLQAHLWSLPLAISEWVEDYRFFLRPHRLEGWDLVCYAVPVERLPGRR